MLTSFHCIIHSYNFPDVNSHDVIQCTRVILLRGWGVGCKIIFSVENVRKLWWLTSLTFAHRVVASNNTRNFVVAFYILVVWSLEKNRKRHIAKLRGSEMSPCRLAYIEGLASYRVMGTVWDLVVFVASDQRVTEISHHRNPYLLCNSNI